MVILVALASLLVPLVGRFGLDAQVQATETTLARTAQAIVSTGGFEQAMRFAEDTSGDDYAFVGGEPTGLPWPGPDQITSGARPNAPQLHFLFVEPELDAVGTPWEYDPTTRIGWNGPWLDAGVATRYDSTSTDDPDRAAFDAALIAADYGSDGDYAPIDGWGNPVVIQLPGNDPGRARLVSAGPDRVLNTGDDLFFSLYGNP
ncbi:MAG: hypothetical protein AAGG01_21355 [Planctomycetota bacterium]